MAVPELGIPRELAEAVPRELADAETRAFTEAETYAIAASKVVAETASLTATVETLTTEKAALETEKADLQTKLDLAVAAREKAEQDLADYKANEARTAEIAERKTVRVAAVREAAKHLKDDFFTDERAQRWAEMEEPAFASYVSELAAVSVGVPAAAAETAALAGTAVGGEPIVPVASKSFFELSKGGN